MNKNKKIGLLFLTFLKVNRVIEGHLSPISCNCNCHQFHMKMSFELQVNASLEKVTFLNNHLKRINKNKRSDCNQTRTQKHLVNKRTIMASLVIWFHMECSFTNYVVLGSCPVEVTQTSDFVHASTKEFLDIQVTIECGITLKHALDMTRTYS